ncbi:MAG: tetratricopeptide repeat protein [Deltaproteobacteria bacterium]|nr:tetratricopeptide repeat protein [Deltaproteobacteria bacterium]
MVSSRLVPISRAPGMLKVDGIRALTLASLWQTLNDLQYPIDVIASDISLGVWRGQQVAAELYAQLELVLPPPQQVLPAMGRSIVWDEPLPYADVIGTWIDAEASGDRTTRTALDLASRLVVKLKDSPPRTVVVFGPRAGLSWETENTLFLRFLAQGLNDTDSRLVLVHTDNDAAVVPENWQVQWTPAYSDGKLPVTKSLCRLVPGILHPHVATMLATTQDTGDRLGFSLANGHVLVAPEHRLAPRTVSRFAYDQLAAKTKGGSLDWLHAYALFFGNNLYAQPLFLCKEAWQRFAEGGYGIALRLMERAIACAPTLEQQGFFRAQAQGIRIGLLRFAEATGEEDPSPALAPAVRGFLLQSKGWGLVMGGSPALAASYFQQARELLAPYYEGQREFLYLLNISALSRLESGDFTGALEIEAQIEAQASRQEAHDWHLEYVNAINIARLHRRNRDLASAERYYRKAFETTLGAKSESDAVYCNFCFARVYQQRGQATEAFQAYLRTVLHWLSSRAPEALAPRVAKAILGRTPPVSEDLPEAISAALTSCLLSAAAELPQQIALARLADRDAIQHLPAPAFLRTNEAEYSTFCGAVTALVGSPGWSVGVIPWDVPSQCTGEHHTQLRAVTFSLLQDLMPTSRLSAKDALVVDDSVGYEIAGTLLTMVDTALRYDIETVISGASVVTLDPEMRRQLTLQSHVRFSDAVARVEQQSTQELIYFKRYFSPRRLTFREHWLGKALQESPTVEDLWRQHGQDESQETFLSMIRTLERERIIVLSVHEKALAFGEQRKELHHG